jgi:hypothetical protein
VRVTNLIDTASVDAWDDKIPGAVDASVFHYHVYVDMQLLNAGLEAVHAPARVMNRELPDPTMATAAVRAALAVFDLVGFCKDSRSPVVMEAACGLHMRETLSNDEDRKDAGQSCGLGRGCTRNAWDEVRQRRQRQY